MIELDTDEQGPGTRPAGGADPASAAGPPGGFRVPGWAVYGMAAVAVAGSAGTIGFGLAWAHQQSRLDDQAAARAVVSRFLFDLTNFDPSTVTSDFADIQSLATGTFAAQASTVFTSRVRQELANAHATTRGTVKYLALGSYSGSKASFYSRVDQTFANDKAKTPQSDQLQAIVELTKVSGHWKVSQVTTLGAGSVLNG